MCEYPHCFLDVLDFPFSWIGLDGVLWDSLWSWFLIDFHVVSIKAFDLDIEWGYRHAGGVSSALCDKNIGVGSRRIDPTNSSPSFSFNRQPRTGSFVRQDSPISIFFKEEKPEGRGFYRAAGQSLSRCSSPVAFW